MAGIYIHIPFCKQACTYCNFHFSTLLNNAEAMVNGITREILMANDFIDDTQKIDSIYFGGGTPSVLPAESIEQLHKHIRQKFSITSNAEITLEANPDDITAEQLMRWKNIGINRLSVGIQSFDDAELKWMNRAHTAAQSLKCLEEINHAGFKNFSADLIYGSALQSLEKLQQNLNRLFHFRVPHISCYALTVEPKTALHHLIQKKKFPEINPDVQAEAFEIVCRLMQEKGYEQYEISNFCLPGFCSRHNSSYWQGKPYWGFGPAAHSFDGKNKRRWNLANNALYLQNIEKNNLPFEEEQLIQTQQMNEAILISLRTSEGLDMEKFAQHFGKTNADRLLNHAQKYISSEKINLNQQHLVLTQAGKFLADGIAADLFF